LFFDGILLLEQEFEVDLFVLPQKNCFVFLEGLERLELLLPKLVLGLGLLVLIRALKDLEDL
jgi:hypothetical protein